MQEYKASADPDELPEDEYRFYFDVYARVLAAGIGGILAHMGPSTSPRIAKAHLECAEYYARISAEELTDTLSFHNKQRAMPDVAE